MKQAITTKNKKQSNKGGRDLTSNGKAKQTQAQPQKKELMQPKIPSVPVIEASPPSALGTTAAKASPRQRTTKTVQEVCFWDISCCVNMLLIEGGSSCCAVISKERGVSTIGKRISVTNIRLPALYMLTFLLTMLSSYAATSQRNGRRVER